jgi:hypothetical protein
VDKASLVQDVTIPDGTVVTPGVLMVKTWRLRNIGSCTWTTSYTLVFSSGSQLSGPAAQALAGDVPPGESLDITVNLAAPTTEGAYRGDWLLRNDRGALFGIGSAGASPFWVQIVVVRPKTATPVPTAAPPTSTPVPTAAAITEWRGEYFKTQDMSGNPVLVRNDSAIAFAWNNGSPDSRIPADHFSARWTRTLALTAGVYRFQTRVDDGVRVWVDSVLLIDEWDDGALRDFAVDYFLDSGNHTIQVDYYENGGLANVWANVGLFTSGGYPEWVGQYWTNVKLQGSPILSRNDAAINFDWGDGSPVWGMPTNTFSARWTRTLKFAAGTYRFSARVDDGVRIWVDNKLIVDSWADGSVRVVFADYTLTAGNHKIRVDYFESMGDALIKVWWDNVLSLTPTATKTPTLTPTPTLTLTPALSSITGLVWNDLCSMTGQIAQPDDEDTAGCVVNTEGKYQANGQLDTGETGIEGVTVELSKDTCSSAPIGSALTDANGSYSFTDLEAGTYCVFVSQDSVANSTILLTGLWTYPDLLAHTLVVLTSGAEAKSINFGWDDQPEPES